MIRECVEERRKEYSWKFMSSSFLTTRKFNNRYYLEIRWKIKEQGLIIVNFFSLAFTGSVDAKKCIINNKNYF